MSTINKNEGIAEANFPRAMSNIRSIEQITKQYDYYNIDKLE